MMAPISAVVVIRMKCCVWMNSSRATMKKLAAQRLISPLSAAPAPALIAPMMAVVLRPPMADTNTSRPSEPSISRRTSWRKDIRLRRPFNSSRMPITVIAGTGRARKHLAAPRAAQQFSLPGQFGAASHLSAA